MDSNAMDTSEIDFMIHLQSDLIHGMKQSDLIHIIVSAGNSGGPITFRDDVDLTLRVPQPVFRLVSLEERSSDADKEIHKSIEDWTTELTEMPPITHEHIHSYFITDFDCDGKARGALKHKISGYQLFKDNYVKKVKVGAHVKVGTDERFIISNFCTATMKGQLYSVIIHLCQTRGNVLFAYCKCAAGASGSCKHVAATLYQLVEYKELNLKSVPADKTCTDTLQAWHVPGEGPNTDALKFSELTFLKADFKKDQEKKRKRPLVTGRRKFCATPAFAHIPLPEKIQKLSLDLNGLGQGVQFAKVLETNEYKHSDFYETSIKETQSTEVTARSLVTNLLKEVTKGNMDTTLGVADNLFVQKHLTLSSAEIISLESSTIHQSSSDLWFVERQKRITASNFGAILNRKRSIYPESIIKKITNSKKRKASEPCQWGLDNERVAISLYEEKNNCTVHTCGLIVNPKWPWLGASADGVLDNNGSIMAIEVKCPYSKRDKCIEDACKDPKFFLQKNGNEIVLKTSHVHYSQCQGVMAILGLENLDFIVYTEKDIHIENILFQKDKWYNEMLPELTKFYFEFIKDKVFSV